MLTALKNRNHTWRVAHRGCHPENKIIGFRQAIEDGCDMVECDVRLSGDNQPVLIHDTTINRTTNGTGRVSKLTCH
jgi:glycerophosphoryl diester phosphodiesterase